MTASSYLHPPLSLPHDPAKNSEDRVVPNEANYEAEAEAEAEPHEEDGEESPKKKTAW
jgi:hypothetical protein